MQFIFWIVLICVWGRGVDCSLRDEYPYFEDDLTQELYKRLSQINPDNLQDVLSLSDVKEIREAELEELSQPNSQFIYMSGGAGEGKQHLKPDGSITNSHQVKSDDVLPFYCHPPNPCPKGFIAKDGCQEFVEDSAEYQKEWIKRMTSKGLCSCDDEHMFECDSTRYEQSDEDDELDYQIDGMANDNSLDEVINSIVNSKIDNPYLHSGIKRQSLVAKKSPRYKRNIAAVRSEGKNLLPKHLMRSRVKINPFLAGQKLRTVAKKGFKRA